jgi:hypothetical protein
LGFTTEWTRKRERRQIREQNFLAKQARPKKDKEERERRMLAKKLDTYFRQQEQKRQKALFRIERKARLVVARVQASNAKLRAQLDNLPDDTP